MLFPFHDDNPTERTPVVTYALIAINLAAFLATYRLPSVERQLLIYRRGFMPARIGQLIDPKPIAVPVDRVIQHPRHGRPQVDRGFLQLQPIPREIAASLITCMFLHAGWMHLLGNMWFLWIFGNNVEDRLGAVPFLGVYLFGGILASGSHWMVEPDSTAPVIGASGAVATVLGAYAVTWPWARVRTLVFLFVFITVIDLPALLVLGVWFLGQLLAGGRDVGGNVAWWAHIGGFVAGVVMMPLVSAAMRLYGSVTTRSEKTPLP
ncbi:MAG: rhomboid family intramembrane serine protease [Thermoguttaceae bacterium]